MINYNEIRELYRNIDTTKYEPYPVDWIKIFSPIEYMTWSDIRNYDMQMWPQYPIGKYFSDFANINHKLVIECDGKEWHDKEKDRIRDNYMIEQGWTIYRITGSECYKIVYQDEYIEKENLPEFYENFYKTGSGVVKAIYYIHYKNNFLCTDEEFNYMYECLRLHKSKLSSEVYI